MDSARIWESVQKSLGDTMSREEFRRLIPPLKSSFDGSELLLRAPNQHVVNELNARFMRRIHDEIVRNADPLHPVSVRLVVDRDRCSQASKGPRSAGRIGKPGRARGSNNINRAYTFDSFVDGSSNQWAKTAAQSAARSPSSTHNPLLLYGGVGLGKTHLLHAVANDVQSSDRMSRVLYWVSKDFVEKMVASLNRGRIQEFTDHFNAVDLLLIDDIQFLAAKEKCQEEFFHVFNRLHDEGVQMVFTSDQFPTEIDRLEERLQSRLVYGLSAEVKPPDLETRAAILLKKCDNTGVTLPHSVAMYIAERVRKNVRELEGVLRNILLRASQQRESVISQDLVNYTLHELVGYRVRPLTVTAIVDQVTEYFGVRKRDLVGKTRTRTIVRPRQIAMALAREFTDLSLQEIGVAIGNKDHTTVLHACKQVALVRKSDPRFDADYSNLAKLLSQQ